MKNLSMCHRCIKNSEEVKFNYFLAPLIIKKCAVTCKKNKEQNKQECDFKVDKSPKLFNSILVIFQAF